MGAPELRVTDKHTDHLAALSGSLPFLCCRCQTGSVDRQSVRWPWLIVVAGIALMGYSNTPTAGPTTTAVPPVRSTIPFTPQTTTTIPVNNSAHLAVSSTMLTVGGMITISGTDRPIGGIGDVGLNETLNGIVFRPLMSQPTTASVVGDSWKVSTAVPMLEEGPASVSASCGVTTGGLSFVTKFEYPEVPVNVVTADQLAATLDECQCWNHLDRQSGSEWM